MSGIPCCIRSLQLCGPSETLGSSLDLGVDVMRCLGMPAEQALGAARLFKEHDEKSVCDLAQYWDDDDACFQYARLQIEAFERMFASDRTAKEVTGANHRSLRRRAMPRPIQP